MKDQRINCHYSHLLLTTIFLDIDRYTCKFLERLFSRRIIISRKWKMKHNRNVKCNSNYIITFTGIFSNFMITRRINNCAFWILFSFTLPMNSKTDHCFYCRLFLHAISRAFEFFFKRNTPFSPYTCIRMKFSSWFDEYFPSLSINSTIVSFGSEYLEINGRTEMEMILYVVRSLRPRMNFSRAGPRFQGNQWESMRRTLRLFQFHWFLCTPLLYLHTS